MAEAAAKAAGVPATVLRRALMLRGDLGAVAQAALAGGAEALGAFRLEVGRPVRPMLASPAADITAAMEKLSPAAVEWKLDGIRVQVHRDGGDVAVFSRSLDDITARVPAIVEAALALPVRTAVLDGEALGLRADGRPQPFQVSATRATPLSAVFFDVLHADGEDVLDAPGAARADVLAAIVPEALRVPRRVAEDAAGASAVLEEALAMGHEGVIVKSLEAPYAAGRRGAGWLKVKPVHTLDLVVLAAEWGHGRRRGWLSNLHLGARHDTEPGEFVMLGKTFKGLTDAMLTWQTERLLALARDDRADWVVHVRPELVVEIAFDGVQTQLALSGRRGAALRARAPPPARQARRGGRHAGGGARGASGPGLTACSLRPPRSSVEVMRDAPAQDPLTDIRRLYDAWNAGNVARAAALLSPTIIWESFGATPHGLQEATLAGGSGGTWRLSPVAIDLLVGVGRHVIAFSRRSVAPGAAEAQRLEVWTVRDGKAEHYRGYPLEEGLAVLRATTGDGKLDIACRASWPSTAATGPGSRGFFEAEARGFAERLGGARLDDVRVLAETFESLVISAVHYADEASERAAAAPGHRVRGRAGSASGAASES